MKLINPSFEILHFDDEEMVNLIERAGRVCYKSEAKTQFTPESARKFIEGIMERGHDSVIEHAVMTVRIICDRGVTHELVRHRLASYSQESTRYCNYKGGVTFIIPPWVEIKAGEYSHAEEFEGVDHQGYYWAVSMLHCENIYSILLNHGWSPQQARSVLPNSLKTEIIVTANAREWRHIFHLRTSKNAHPQMKEIMDEISIEFARRVPVLFG
jgi:thymidylate synthase (FAD)